MTSTYKAALEDARRDLASTQAEIDRLEGRLAELRQTVATLARLCNEPSGIEEQMGITDAIRAVLKSSGRYMTLSEVVRGVEDIGFPLHKQVAPTASVATILNRLVRQSEALKKDSGGASAWGWKGRFSNLERLAKLNTDSVHGAPPVRKARRMSEDGEK